LNGRGSSAYLTTIFFLSEIKQCDTLSTGGSSLNEILLFFPDQIDGTDVDWRSTRVKLPSLLTSDLHGTARC